MLCVIRKAIITEVDASRSAWKHLFLATRGGQIRRLGHAARQAADVILESVVVLLQLTQVRLHVLTPVD